MRADLERVLDDERLLVQIDREIDLEKSREQQLEELAHVRTLAKLYEVHYSEVCSQLNLSFNCSITTCILLCIVCSI